MQFTDAVSVKGTQLTSEGYLQADAYAVRTGIQYYRASEVGLVGDHLVAVYRPPEEVFAKDSVASFARVPVTMDHPAELVTADTWDAVAIGETDSEILRDGERLRIPMTIRSADAIRAVQDGKRELSAGYVCDLDWTAGTTKDGEHYDAVQRGIRANHIAIVAKGRAGSEFRIGDSAGTWGATPITVADKEVKMSLRKVMVDGLEVETTEAGATAIKKLETALSDAAAAHDEALAAKDAELAEKDAEIEELKAKVLSDADLDARVQARADLVCKAKALVKDFDAVGKSDADIRRAVVVAKRGAAMADKSEAYIDAAFDLLLEAAEAGQPDPVRGVLGDAQLADGDYNDEYRKAIADAWKSTPVKEV